MHRTIRTLWLLAGIFLVAETLWATGEARRQIRPLNYQQLRSYTESQQVVPNYLADRYPDDFEVRTRRNASQYLPPTRRYVPEPPLNYGQLRTYVDRQYESPPDNPLTRDIYSNRKSVRTIIREPMDMR